MHDACKRRSKKATQKYNANADDNANDELPQRQSLFSSFIWPQFDRHNCLDILERKRSRMAI